MAIDTSFAFYERIKQGLRDSGKKKNFGFFNFSDISLGKPDPSQFNQNEYIGFSPLTKEGPIEQSYVAPGMVPEQVPQAIRTLDYSKGTSPGGFYRTFEAEVGMPAATAPGGQAVTKQTRTQTLTDAQAFDMLGIAPGQYDVLDEVMSNLGFMNAYEYSRTQDPVGSMGPTKTTQGGRSLGETISGLSPLGFAGALMGDVYSGLGGRPELEAFGLYGVAGRMNYENLYDIAKQEQRGRPGYGVYVSPEGQLRGFRPTDPDSIRAKLFGQEFSYYGAPGGDINTVKNELSMNLGYDPATFDLNTLRGESLEGFALGFGGFDSSGNFVNMKGERSTGLNSGYRGMQYASAVADIYGADYASNLMRTQATRIANEGGFFSQSRAGYYTSIADKIQQGMREEYAFGTGKDKYTGGYVRTSTGQPVRSKSGFVYSGQKVEPTPTAPAPSSGDSGYTGQASYGAAEAAGGTYGERQDDGSVSASPFAEGGVVK